MQRSEIISKFAGNIRAERARKHYSQEYLAERAGITVEYLSRIECEKYNPSLVVAVNLALALGVDLNTLLPLQK